MGKQGKHIFNYKNTGLGADIKLNEINEEIKSTYQELNKESICHNIQININYKTLEDEAHGLASLYDGMYGTCDCKNDNIEFCNGFIFEYYLLYQKTIDFVIKDFKDLEIVQNFLHYILKYHSDSYKLRTCAEVVKSIDSKNDFIHFDVWFEFDDYESEFGDN